jgi:uncharacterized protein (DUF2336 family)
MCPRDEQNATNTHRRPGFSDRGHPAPPSRTMTTGVLQEIQTAIEGGNVSNHGALLRHVTDLFIVGSAEHSEADLSLFDIVFNQLVVEIETSARAFLAARLAPLQSTPPNIIRRLAFDDEVDVAGPILSQSDRLDDPTLVENASKKGQEHLFAISRRKSRPTS